MLSQRALTEVNESPTSPGDAFNNLLDASQPGEESHTERVAQFLLAKCRDESKPAKAQNYAWAALSIGVAERFFREQLNCAIEAQGDTGQDQGLVKALLALSWGEMSDNEVFEPHDLLTQIVEDIDKSKLLTDPDKKRIRTNCEGIGKPQRHPFWPMIREPEHYDEVLLAMYSVTSAEISGTETAAAEYHPPAPPPDRQPSYNDANPPDHLTHPPGEEQELSSSENPPSEPPEVHAPSAPEELPPEATGSDIDGSSPVPGEEHGDRERSPENPPPEPPEGRPRARMVAPLPQPSDEHAPSAPEEHLAEWTEWEIDGSSLVPAEEHGDRGRSPENTPPEPPEGRPRARMVAPLPQPSDERAPSAPEQHFPEGGNSHPRWLKPKPSDEHGSSSSATRSPSGTAGKPDTPNAQPPPPNANEDSASSDEERQGAGGGKGEKEESNPKRKGLPSRITVGSAKQYKPGDDEGNKRPEPKPSDYYARTKVIGPKPKDKRYMYHHRLYVSRTPVFPVNVSNDKILVQRSGSDKGTS